MDPIAHTMVGAALAGSGLRDRSRFAAAALVLGANLPDVDALTYFLGGDLGLLFRRGWTHGLPAVALWPFLLAGALVGLDRSLGSQRARFPALLALGFLAVSTHPALDWLNTYGMRWLMPFEGRWLYGDALFIVDPWIWLTLGGALFLSTTARVYGAGWVLLAIPATLLVVNGVSGVGAGKILFVAGLFGLGVLKWLGWPGSDAASRRVNQVALATVAAYIVSMIAIQAFGERATLALLEEQGLEVVEVMVGPRPITPFEKDVLVVAPDGYRYGTLTLGLAPELTLSPVVLPRPGSSPIIARALAAPEVRGFATWARFPWAEIDEAPEGAWVHLADARYVRDRESRGFGTASVFLPSTATPELHDSR